MANARDFGIAAGLGGIGAGIGGMFGGGHHKDPYKAASKYFNQIPGTVTPYFQPYINAGQNALGQMQGQYGSLLGNLPGVQNQFDSLINDPNALYSKIAAGYQKSPGYDWQLNQGLNAATNAAAAGGMAGSPEHQQQAAGIAEGLASQDFNNYLGHVLGLYGTGLQGKSGLYGMGLEGLGGIGQMGYNASNELAGALASSLMNQGNLAYSGTAARNQQQGQGIGNILGGLGALAAFL